ncbi:class III lanthionine synthetase LanKC [Flindersiella endophytica]
MQGWKLHVSATVTSAHEVLRHVVDVLAADPCAFKFAADLERVRELNGGRFARGSAGKFVTVYPADDEQFRRLAAGLHEATRSLTGPVILSDRPYKPGSLVHFRYGGMTGQRVLSNDGEYLDVLTAPDGRLVEDRRDAWFAPPPWARSPFETAADSTTPPTAEAVLLADRFEVHRAIRHANKGGVFEALDRTTNCPVIVKQARAHVATRDGWDVRDALRNEADMLDRLAPLGIAPKPIALFEQGGDLFLAQERIAGTTLREWFAAQTRGTTRPGLPWPALRATIRDLVDLLWMVHRLGIVLYDFTPANILIRDDGGFALVDLEFATRLGELGQPAGTPGFMAPEQTKQAKASTAIDRYALGALILLLATGSDPLFPPDEPAGSRSTHQRTKDWLGHVAADDETVNRIRPIVVALLADAAADRVQLHQVRAQLDEQSRPRPTRATQPAADLDRMIEDGTAFLRAKMTPDSTDRLWPASLYGSRSDACNVHHGAAGVLATLTTVARHTEDEQIRATVRAAVDWLAGHAPTGNLLPGLHFGRAGTAWAWYDAATLLGDEQHRERAIDLAKRLPLDWPNPDVTHGVAGNGIANLYFWRETHDDEFRQRAHACATTLAEQAEQAKQAKQADQSGRQDGLLLWPIPQDFESRLAGTIDYGFAHGVAGIAAFLLSAGTHLDQPAWVDLAHQAGETLRSTAHQDDHGALWPSGPRDLTNLREHWCSGSSGIGTFLIRLWQVTNAGWARDLAEQAGDAGWRRRWTANPSMCHGLAGNGDFLLDLADATGDDRFRTQAEDLARALHSRAAHRDGRLLASDETVLGFGADYGVGVAGWLSFLSRLRHGGARRWMVEPV